MDWGEAQIFVIRAAKRNIRDKGDIAVIDRRKHQPTIVVIRIERRCGVRFNAHTVIGVQLEPVRQIPTGGSKMDPLVTNSSNSRNPKHAHSASTATERSYRHGRAEMYKIQRRQ